MNNEIQHFKNVLTETMIIPLWARAVENEDKDPILKDGNAKRILNSLGYDLNYYDKRKQNASQVGCCLRAKWMDDEAMIFIKKSGACQVIQLGAGVDDRFGRLGMPKEVVKWYDLDLAEVIALRKKVVPEVERCEMLAMDMMDKGWMQKLKASGLPTLVIIDGVVMYLDGEQLRGLFDDMAEVLGGATVLLDSVPAFAVGKAKMHDSVKKKNKKVEFNFGLKEPVDIEEVSTHVKLLEGVRMSDLPKAYKFMWLLRFVFWTRFGYKRFNQLLLKIKVA